MIKILSPNKPNGIRSAGIVIKDEKILLMYRENGDKKYFTFPGGKVEENENVEQAAMRELWEECSVKIEIEKLLYYMDIIDNSDQYFYKCKFISGEIKLGNFNEMEADKKGGIHKPIWFSLSEIKNIILYPLEIRGLLIKDLENNFAENNMRSLRLGIEEIKN